MESALASVSGLALAPSASLLSCFVAGSRKDDHGILLPREAGGLDVRACGVPNQRRRSSVVPNRPTKSISAEDTFEHDVLLADTESMIRLLAEKVWTASRKESRIPRTVVLKLKTADFNILTRSHTPESALACCEELTAIALGLRD